MKSFVKKQRVKSNLNLFIQTVILLFSIFVVMSIGVWKEIYNDVNGPVKISEEELANISNVNEVFRNKVIVTGNKLIDTGCYTVKGAKKTSKIYALFMDNKILLVKYPTETNDISFNGRITSIPGKLQNDIVVPLENDNSTKNMILPYMLDCTQDIQDIVICVIGLCILAIWVIYDIIALSLRLINPNKNPVNKELIKYGKVSEVTKNIDCEIELGNYYKENNYLLTKTWIIRKGFIKIDVVYLDNIVWIYKKIIHKKGSLFNKNQYALVLALDNGSSYELPFKSEKKSMNIMDKILKTKPWISAGYSEAMLTAWTLDRAKVVHERNQMRDEYNN